MATENEYRVIAFKDRGYLDTLVISFQGQIDEGVVARTTEAHRINGGFSRKDYHVRDAEGYGLGWDVYYVRKN